MSIERYEIGKTMSRAVKHDGVVYLCGLTADDQTAGMRAQTEQVLKKIDGYLAQAGTEQSRLLPAPVYVSDMSRKSEMNDAWHAWVGLKTPPNWATAGTATGHRGTPV